MGPDQTLLLEIILQFWVTNARGIKVAGVISAQRSKYYYEVYDLISSHKLERQNPVRTQNFKKAWRTFFTKLYSAEKLINSLNFYEKYFLSKLVQNFRLWQRIFETNTLNLSSKFCKELHLKIIMMLKMFVKLDVSLNELHSGFKFKVFSMEFLNFF